MRTQKAEKKIAVNVCFPINGKTGLRRGEICGLRWNDIDFYRHTITVRSAVGVSSGKDGDYTKNPKNKSSNRTFPMMPQLEEALTKRKTFINPLDSWYVIGEQEQFM